MWVGCAGDDVYNVAVPRKDLWQRADYIFKAFVGRQEPARKQYRRSFGRRQLPEERWFLEGQIGNAMRNHFDLFLRNAEYILQKTGRVLAHDNQAVGAGGNFLHHDELVNIWLAKNRMQGCDNRYVEVAEKMQDMAAGPATKDSVLVLQRNDIDAAGIDKLGCCPIGREIGLG